MARRRVRGTGSVFYDRNAGVWIANVSLGVHDGRRVRRKVRAATEHAAREELERLARAYRGGSIPANVTLDSYLGDWIHAHGRSVRASTAKSYSGHIEHHLSPFLGGIPLARLQPADVRRLVDDLDHRGLSPASIHRIVATLRAALNAAVGDRFIVDNVAAHIRLPRVESKPVQPLTALDADAIEDAVAGHWCEPIIRLLLGSGMRLGEAIGLDQGDLQLDAGYVRVRVSKTRARAIPISDGAVVAVRLALAGAPRLGPHEPVFFAPRRGDRLRGDSVTHVFPRLLVAAGLPPLTPHGLRHGAATLMLAQGVPMRVIADQLGHRNPALTARTYAHVVPEQQRAAVAALERRQTR